MLRVPTHGAIEYRAFNILPKSFQFLGLLGVVYTDHVLFDYRTLIEIRGDIVGGGANQFYAALEGLVVGACALEPGQE